MPPLARKRRRHTNILSNLADAAFPLLGKKREVGRTDILRSFPETTKYFGDPQKVWMVNFRVHDLDKMVAQLRAAGN